MSWFFLKKTRQDPSVKELTDEIEMETEKLRNAINTLDSEVSSMKEERKEMDDMLDQAISLVSRKRKR